MSPRLSGFEVCGLKKIFALPTYAKQLHPYSKIIDYFRATTVSIVPGATIEGN
jgi:hypothetical protein